MPSQLNHKIIQKDVIKIKTNNEIYFCLSKKNNWWLNNSLNFKTKYYFRVAKFSFKNNLLQEMGY